MPKGKINKIIDLNNAGAASMQARKILKELTENERTEKAAFIDLHPFAGVIASFLLGIFGIKNYVTLKKRRSA